MKVNHQYAVVYREGELILSEQKLAFFETKEDLEAFITSLNEAKTKLGRRLSYFASVFPKNACYPTDYENFSKETTNKARKTYNVGNGYFVQRTLKNGKVKSKSYNFREDFDWQLHEWKEKGNTNILILDFDESLSADYYYDSDIGKVWGEQEQPLFQ